MTRGEMYANARPAGGRSRIAGPLCIALVALAATCPPALAQLPDLAGPNGLLPLPDGAVSDAVPKQVTDALPNEAERVVGGAVNDPLPDPVEQIVQQSPVAPVRDEVRRALNEATGGGGSGGSGGSAAGNGSGAGSGTGTGTSSGTGTGGSSRPRPRTNPRRADRRAGAGPREAARTIAARRSDAGSSNAARTSRARDEQPSDGVGSATIRRIETIVKAIPTFMWIALGLLALLALGLGARTFVERRRAGALARDREQLRRDVASLERALLPAVPDRLGALATSVAYRPSEGPAAGGDFYDAFELPGGRAAIIVGDVSGHGPDALESTNSVRAQLHGCLESGMSPRAAIAAVGERAPVQLAGRFTTVVVAVHDPAVGTLTYATAGHPPPIVAGPGAEEPLAVGASPPVGLGVRTGVRQTTIPLPAGSLACFFTDGLVEAKAADGMFGRARLTELVGTLGPDDEACTVLEGVVAEAEETPDDMAVFLVRPVTGADRLSPRVELLEIDPDDVENGFAARFLASCEVAPAELAPALESARQIVDSTGTALVEVTISGGVGHARVSAAVGAVAAA
ncbi:MAG: hypothetical protein QOE69_3258 [Thermoleophilaceae bacterium]|nr:hypothetical protein [Thermoleophilaceae bacterium]